MLHFNGLSINKEMPMIYIYGTEGILQIGDPNTFCGEVKLICVGSHVNTGIIWLKCVRIPHEVYWGT